MSHGAAPTGRDLGFALLLAVILAGSSFLSQARPGLNLADEGFLWYGVQRTAAGEVPLRDFQSYDPGRYYWCAAGSYLFGQGLVALRFSEAVCQVLGLWMGLLTARRITQDWKLLAVIGVMVTVWMYPTFKVFDHVLLLAALFVATRMVEKPSRRRIFASGCFVGLCAFFGRNHALYNFLAMGGLLFLFYLKTRKEVSSTRFLAWFTGIGLGLAPLLMMCLCLPGFVAAYRESLGALFRNGANLGLPVPWPWRISLGAPSLTSISLALLGLFFLALPLSYLAFLAGALRMRAESLRKYSLLVASGFIGLCYAHHAFSRADYSHLAQAIHPFTLGLCAAMVWLGFSKKILWLTAIMLMVAGLIGVGRLTPFFQRLTAEVPWTESDAGNRIFVPPADAGLYDCLRNFARQNLRPHETLLIAPYTPGLYPILDRPSPLWEIDFFFAATKESQERDVAELAAKGVNWALISDATIDGREDLRFSSTHKLLWDYLKDNFSAAPVPCLRPGMTVFHRKQNQAP